MGTGIVQLTGLNLVACLCVRACVCLCIKLQNESEDLPPEVVAAVEICTLPIYYIMASDPAGAMETNGEVGKWFKGKDSVMGMAKGGGTRDQIIGTHHQPPAKPKPTP